MYKYFINSIKEYILIILTATIFLLIFFSKSFSDENIFIVENVKVEGVYGLNFNRNKYINKAFLESFQILLSRILLSKDLDKINNIELNNVKNLINSFQILDENFSSNKYKANFKIFYNGTKFKKMLVNKNISFSEPKKISSIFFPALFVNDEFKELNENYFFKNWLTTKIINETINFILPLDDLEDVSKIKFMKDKFEKINVESIVNKYDVKNYAFALMDYENKQLYIHLKTNFNGVKTSKNIFYELDNIKDEKKLETILKDIKLQITDIWKEENVINLAIPLKIKIKFKHDNLKNLDNLKNILYKINIIDNFSLEEFDIRNSIFKLYYYGDPKKLQTELFKFGYNLKNDMGFWEIYIDG